MNFQNSDLKFGKFLIIPEQAIVFVDSKLVRGILEKQTRSVNQPGINKNKNSRRQK